MLIFHVLVIVRYLLKIRWISIQLCFLTVSLLIYWHYIENESFNCTNTIQYLKLSPVSESLKYVLSAKQELIQWCEGSTSQSTGSLKLLCCSSNETLNWPLGSTCCADWLQFQLPCNFRLLYIAPLWICLCTIRFAVTKRNCKKSRGPVGVTSGMLCAVTLNLNASPLLPLHAYSCLWFLFTAKRFAGIFL